MKTIKYFLLAPIVFLLCSCSEEIITNTTNAREGDIFDQMGRSTHGVIGFQIQNGPNPDPKLLMAISFFSDTTGAERIDGGIVELEGWTFKPDAENNFIYSPVENELSDEFVHSLYGKNIDFTFYNNPITSVTRRNSQGQMSEGMLYVPEIIELSHPKSTPGNLARVNRKDEGGLNIRWNPDTRNEHPVLIQLLWGGSTLDADGNKLDEPSQRQSTFFKAKDNGSYTIRNEELTELPENAFLTIILTRGNVKTITQDDRDYQVLGRSLGVSYAVLE